LSFLGRLFGSGSRPRVDTKSNDSLAIGGGSPALLALTGGNVFAKVDLAKLADAPKDDAGLVKLAGNHPVVYMCVRKIAWSAASVPWQASYNGEDIPPEHPVVKLLNKPDPMRSRWELYQLLAASLATTGNAYLLQVPSPSYAEGMNGEAKYKIKAGASRRIRKDKAGEFPISAMLFLRPDRVRPYINSTTNQIEYYDYFNAGNSGYQRLPLYASLVTLARKLAANIGGVPGMLVFSQAQGMSDTQRSEMQSHLGDFKSDGDKFGELLLVDIASGDVKFVPIGGDISKMQPKETKMDAAREIANLMGVPPLLLSQGEGSTFSNMEEANRSFWLDTVVPGYLTPIADAIGNTFGITVAPDLSEVSALSKLNSQLTATLATAWWLTTDEKRSIMGYAPMEGGMGARIVVPMGQTPLDTLVATSDASAIEMHDPQLLQSIISAAAQGDQKAVDAAIAQVQAKMAAKPNGRAH
jgi:hypothetical protein